MGVGATHSRSASQVVGGLKVQPQELDCPQPRVGSGTFLGDGVRRKWKISGISHDSMQ